MMQESLKLSKIAFKRIENYPNRPFIIFLHDSLGCIKLWREFPEELGELTQCNVIAYDRQGYGDSCGFTYSERDPRYLELEADILMDLIDYWGISSPLLFGHSDGGSIALIAAGKYPTKIKGVITEGSHIFVEDITLKGINDAVRLYQSTNLPAKLEKYHGNKTDQMFWAWAKTWNTPEFKDWDIQHFLPSIQCPTLVIQGSDDEYGSLKQVTLTQKGIGCHCETLIIPGVRHTPHKENVEVTLKSSTEFISKI